MKFTKIIVYLSVLALFTFNTQQPVLARFWFFNPPIVQKEAQFNISKKTLKVW